MNVRDWPPPAEVLAYTKGYAATIGVLATGLLGIFAGGEVGHVLTVVAGVCTVIGVVVVPNTGVVPASRVAAFRRVRTNHVGQTVSEVVAGPASPVPDGTPVEVTPGA